MSLRRMGCSNCGKSDFAVFSDPEDFLAGIAVKCIGCGSVIRISVAVPKLSFQLGEPEGGDLLFLEKDKDDVC